MSTPGQHLTDRAGRSLEEQREAVLKRAQPLPRYEEMVVEGLSDDEEAAFLAALSDK